MRLSSLSISFIPMDSLNMKWKRRDRPARTSSAALWSRCCSKWIFYLVFLWINNVIVNTYWRESKEWPECLSYQQSRASERYTRQTNCRLFKAFRQVCTQSGAVPNDWNRLEVWGRYARHLDVFRAQPSVFQIVIWYNSAFSYDVTASILVFQKDETVAMLVIQTNPVKME